MKWAVVETCEVTEKVSGILSYKVKSKAQCSGLKAGRGLLLGQALMASHGAIM